MCIICEGPKLDAYRSQSVTNMLIINMKIFVTISNFFSEIIYIVTFNVTHWDT